MDTMTMDYRKIQLAQFILGISDSALLNRISSVISDVTQADHNEPCHYTMQEVEERLRVCEEDAIEGVGIAQEELEAESLNWI